MFVMKMQVTEVTRFPTADVKLSPRKGKPIIPPLFPVISETDHYFLQKFITEFDLTFFFMCSMMVIFYSISVWDAIFKSYVSCL